MVKAVLKFGASLGVLAVLLYFMDSQAIFARLANADLLWLGAALLALTALTFLMARRWQATVHLLGLDLGYTRAVMEYYLAQLLNLVLPGGVVGDVSRAVRLRKDGDMVLAAQSVLIERLIGQTSLFTVMFLAFLAAMLVPDGLPWPAWTWGILAIGVCVAVVLLGMAFGRNRIGRFIRLTLRVLRRVQQLILSTLIVLLIVFSFYACAAATGTVLPAAAWFTLIPLVLTSMLIPLSVGGWGWREGAAAALFPIAGASADAGVATGIAYGAMMLIAALPAVFVLFFQPRRSNSQDNIMTDA